jgi:hypothetical protein
MSRPVPVFHGHIDEAGHFGLLTSEAPARQMYFRSLAGCDVDITVKKHRTDRSLEALGYYWGVVLAIAEDHTGQPADDIHDAMVERFVPSEAKRLEFVNRMNGESIAIGVEVKHSPKQGGPFFDFVENVRQFLREFLDIDTPDPDPQYWRKRASKAA